jgi:cytochrome c peroxidase
VGSISSWNSKFDHGNENFTAMELQGRNIFQGKGRCYNCHNGSDLNGYSTDYENIGLEVNYADKGRGKITQNANDDGKFIVPSLRNIELSAPYMHDGRFKTLREVIDHYSEGIQDSKNLSYTFRDLSGLPNSTIVRPNNPPNTFVPDNLNSLPNNQNPIVSDNLNSFPVSKLNLTEDEKKALEAFLKTLTDVSFIADPKFSNPF